MTARRSRCASHRIAWHGMASHRIASYRIVSMRQDVLGLGIDVDEDLGSSHDSGDDVWSATQDDMLRDNDTQRRAGNRRKRRGPQRRVQTGKAPGSRRRIPGGGKRAATTKPRARRRGRGKSRQGWSGTQRNNVWGADAAESEPPSPMLNPPRQAPLITQVRYPPGFVVCVCVCVCVSWWGVVAACVATDCRCGVRQLPGCVERGSLKPSSRPAKVCWRCWRQRGRRKRSWRSRWSTSPAKNVSGFEASFERFNSAAQAHCYMRWRSTTPHRRAKVVQTVYVRNGMHIFMCACVRVCVCVCGVCVCGDIPCSHPHGHP